MDNKVSFCSHCGQGFTPSVKFCPSCGTLNPVYASDSGGPSYDSTVVSSPSGAPLRALPPTPSDSPLPNPYAPLDPYNIPVPPPPSPRRRVWRLLLGAVVLTLILVGIGVSALLLQGTKNNSLVNAPTLTAITAQASASTAAATAATATPAYQDYVQATSALVLDDPLSDNSKGYRWSEYNSTKLSARCWFTGGAYEVDASPRRVRAVLLANRLL